MAEPRRLLEQLGSGIERDLLLSGSSERAPAAARGRIEAVVLGAAPLACGVVLPPEAAVAAGGGASAPSTTALFASVAKWLAIGVFAGGALSGAAAGVSALPAERAPELLELPSVSGQIADATERMKAERKPEAIEAAARTELSKPRQTALRRATGKVLIGAPATSRPDSLDPNRGLRTSTSER